MDFVLLSSTLDKQNFFAQRPAVYEWDTFRFALMKDSLLQKLNKYSSIVYVFPVMICLFESEGFPLREEARNNIKTGEGWTLRPLKGNLHFFIWLCHV